RRAKSATTISASATAPPTSTGMGRAAGVALTGAGCCTPGWVCEGWIESDIARVYRNAAFACKEPRRRGKKRAMRNLVIALAVLGLAGCIEESPMAHQGTPRPPRSAESPQPSAPVAAPTPAPSGEAPAQPSGNEVHAAGAVFENALQVAAYKFDPPSAQ